MPDDIDTTDIDADLEDGVAAPINETKTERFRRLANARFRKTVHQLQLLANLSNRSSYEYTPEQVTTLVTTLRAKIDELERAFSDTPKADDIPEL